MWVREGECGLVAKVARGFFPLRGWLWFFRGFFLCLQRFFGKRAGRAAVLNAVNHDRSAGWNDFVEGARGFCRKADAAVGGGAGGDMALVESHGGRFSVERVEAHEVAHRRTAEFHSLGDRAGAGIELAGLLLAGLGIDELAVEVRCVAGVFLADFVIAGGRAKAGFAACNPCGCYEFAGGVDVGALAVEVHDHNGALGVEGSGGEFGLEYGQRGGGFFQCG